MTTAVLQHPAFRGHRTPPGHPECVERIVAVEAELARPELAGLRRVEAPLAAEAALLRVHAAAHLESVRRASPAAGVTNLDADTSMSPGSLQAALRAAGAACAAVDLVASGDCRNAFCAVRPPGHHAERRRAMGFCLFANAAVAARHALAEHGMERVAILDFDVHHGNGTQDVVEDDPAIFFASSHQMPLFPGTGHESETGVGNLLNLPLAAGSGSAEFRRGWQDRILPRVEAFRPDLVVVSAGFDAHAEDPLAQLCLCDEDFSWITQRILEVADRTCAGRVVSTLEGGYALGALARCVGRHLRVLMDPAGGESDGS